MLLRRQDKLYASAVFILSPLTSSWQHRGGAVRRPADPADWARLSISVFAVMSGHGPWLYNGGMTRRRQREEEEEEEEGRRREDNMSVKHNT